MKFPVVKSSHVVPRMYLRGFADDEGRIAVRVPGQAEPHIVNVKNAGTRSKFYARERPDGTEIHDIEWSLSHIEAAAGPVLRRLSDAWPLALSDKAILAELFAIQILRGPRWIEWPSSLRLRTSTGRLRGRPEPGGHPVAAKAVVPPPPGW